MILIYSSTLRLGSVRDFELIVSLVTNTSMFSETLTVCKYAAYTRTLN
jgi:hypothetical protein